MAYRSAHADLRTSLGSWSCQDPNSVLGARQRQQQQGTKRCIDNLPAPALLVPAALEALTATANYARLTEVVPGEADTYCAERARELGGGSMIFTSDSDLLVYDLGEDAAVVFFRDLSFHDGIAGLECRRYETGKIARRLGLNGMAALAYEVEQNPSMAFSTLVQRAGSGYHHNYSSGFQTFLKRYQGSEMSSHHGRQDESVRAVLKRLDPRVSELVCQYLYSSLSLSLSAEEEQLTMYLPFLHDDPSRSSAWQVGASIRALAYSILSRSTRGIVQEVRPRGQRIVSIDMPLTDSIITTDQLLSLHSTFTTLVDQEDGKGKEKLWTFISLHLLIQDCLLDNKNRQPPPTRKLVKSLLSSSLDQECNHHDDYCWAAIHLHAQIQAVMYSLRMLRQVIDLVNTCTRTRTTKRHDVSEEQQFQSLGAVLQTLPALNQSLLLEVLLVAATDDDDDDDIFERYLDWVYQGVVVVVATTTNNDDDDLRGKKNKKRRYQRNRDRDRDRMLKSGVGEHHDDEGGSNRFTALRREGQGVVDE